MEILKPLCSTAVSQILVVVRKIYIQQEIWYMVQSVGYDGRQAHKCFYCVSRSFYLLLSLVHHFRLLLTILPLCCTAWHRSAKSDHEDEGVNDTLPPLLSRIGESRSHETLPRGSGTAASNVLRQKQRMSFKAAGQATLGFLSARRRLEDGLKCFSKRRQSRRESLCGDCK